MTFCARVRIVLGVLSRACLRAYTSLLDSVLVKRRPLDYIWLKSIIDFRHEFEG